MGAKPFVRRAALLMLMISVVAGAAVVRAQPIAATMSSADLVSPDGRTKVHFGLDDAGRFGFAVERAGVSIFSRSTLGLALDGSAPLSEHLQVTAITRASIDEPYELAIPTKVRHARDHCEQATVDLEETAGERRRLQIIFRAYDDGVAFRYVVPEQPTLKTITLTDELTELRLAADPFAYALPLKNYQTSYEGYYDAKPLSQMPADALIGMPLLLQFEHGPAIAITEADLTDYAGLYLTPVRGDADGAGPTLRAALSPLPGQSQIKVRGKTPFRSPWRVVMMADTPGALIESTLVLNLNPPSAITDTSWIHAGKVAFPWWNGYVLPAGSAFNGDVNTQTLRYYIDFCAENGIEFASIDGNTEAWYGGPNTPWLGADVTKPRPDLDLPAVMAYAKEKGVRIRLWMHWAGLRARLDEALDTYERWGIDGIMLDFMERDDQEMVNFYHEVAAKAAAHHLTVNFHGAFKPTGLERTYPNVMNYEAALNLEYNKWAAEQSRGCPPRHELTIPFTRMLAGPVDFHSGGMRSVRPDRFDFRYLAPLVMGTRAHQLARYVVYENPLPMLADDPAAYRAAAGFEFIKAVPTTWDETHVLSGTVGDEIVIARRHGDDWWLGAMSGDASQTLKTRLAFLGDGSFEATIFADDRSPDSPATAVTRATRTVTSGDTLTIDLDAAGGQAIHFARKSATTRSSRR